MPTYQTRNPLARTNPLRSIPTFRPAPVTHTPEFLADWALQISRRGVSEWEKRFAHYCGALGTANRLKGPMRRHWQAQAFRGINSARAELRAARKALIAAETAMLAFAPVVPA